MSGPGRPAQVGEDLWFPPAESACRIGAWDGLVAVGGDLSVPRLRLAYRSGLFPWTANPVTWWSPDPRGILELDGLHVSRSLAKEIRRGAFQVTINRAFPEVIAACAASGKKRGSTWIAPDFIAAYVQLHQAGGAHSLEVWQDGALAGGIYGVAINGLFAGESMFHLRDNASKVALYCLVEHLRERGFLLFDIQMATPHTRSMGAVEISRAEYLRRLRLAMEKPCLFCGRDSS